MLQLPPAKTDPDHEIHMRYVQNVPRLLSRLQTRQEDCSRKKQLCVCAWVRMGRMSHLQKKVKLDTRKCYIQRLPKDEDDPKMKRVPGDEVGTRPFTEPDRRPRRSRYSSLRRERSTSSSVLRLRSHQRRRGQSDTHSSLPRRWRVRRHGVLLKSQLHRWHVSTPRILENRESSSSSTISKATRACSFSNTPRIKNSKTRLPWVPSCSPWN